MTNKLLTAAECLAAFGDPNLQKHLVVWDIPTALEIGVIPKKLYCHKKMIGPLTKAFEALISTGAIKELKTWDGCFNIRPSRGSKVTSLHAWALAIDVNQATNRFGAKPTLSATFVKCFTDNGFDWGGVWSKPDGMHFQLKASIALGK